MTILGSRNGSTQVRRNALNYVNELPNFIVRQRVRRFTRDPRSGAWQPQADEIVALVLCGANLDPATLA